MRELTYYRIELVLQSPLCIGTSDSVHTDRDVICRPDGTPFIPATSLAGVFRSYFNEAEQKKFFGDLQPAEGDASESAVFIYDAELVSEGYTRSVRNGVRLAEKTPIPGAKYDYEVVETGARFRTYLEITDTGRCPAERLETMLAAVSGGRLLFGSKTSRGFGRVKVEAVNKRTFCLPKDRSAWLDFDLFSQDAFSDTEPVRLDEVKNGDTVLRLVLIQRGGISIREYATGVGIDGKTEPDYHQLCLASGVPVIPGTSWAGAFRQRYAAFCGEQAAEELFGFAKEKQAQKSRVSFSESRLSDGVFKDMTRNSIDRFSAGTKDGALYTERTYFNGKTQLQIRVDKTCAYALPALLAAVMDLDNGFLAVGGLTAVGRGLFHVTKAECNGADITNALHKEKIDEILEGVRQ